jgi:diaminohydroxyphosphoribosylaminopyrimidine deaminase/5-amino-6-(5-phosphoribosylamino)uracil reductase
MPRWWPCGAPARGARGATLYVTLEPCSTWGRTPPCTEAILAAGIRRVVVSVRDPNPRHAGRGLLLLRKAGLQVVDGVLADEGRDLLAPFARWITTGRPMVTLKLGVSVDGCIADAAGRSRWITGTRSRRAVHDLRRRVDAILVGRRTVELDDPSLLPVPTLGRRPLRVVLDARGRLPLKRRLFTDGLPGQTLVLTSTESSSRYRAKLAKRGVAVALLRGRAGVLQAGPPPAGTGAARHPARTVRGGRHVGGVPDPGRRG